MSASPDLDPHWSTLPHAEVLAVLPEGTATTVEQMLARLCPAPDPMPAFDSLQGFAYSMGTTSTAGKLNNTLREMVHAGALCQHPPGRDLHAAVFWRAGDLAGQGEAAGIEFMRLRAAVAALAERARAVQALANEFHESLPAGAGLNLWRTAEGLSGARLAFTQSLTTLEKLR